MSLRRKSKIENNRKAHRKVVYSISSNFIYSVVFLLFWRGLYFTATTIDCNGSTWQRIHGSPLPIISSRKFEKLMAFKKIMWCNFRGWTCQILRMILNYLHPYIKSTSIYYFFPVLSWKPDLSFQRISDNFFVRFRKNLIYWLMQKIFCSNINKKALN